MSRIFFLLAFLMLSFSVSPAHALPSTSFSLKEQERSFGLAKSYNVHRVIPRESKEKKFVKLPGGKKFYPLGRKIFQRATKLQPLAAKPPLEQEAPLASQQQETTEPEDKSETTTQTPETDIATLLGWPIDNAAQQWISSPFGWREDPFTKEQAFHAGVDIAAREGTTVRAAAAGEVAAVGEHPRLGRFVKVIHQDDPDTYSLYGHLKRWVVNQGDTVRLGQKLGEVGLTGRTTGAHLDYSLRRKGEAVDPLEYLSVPKAIKGLEISALK